MNLTKEVIGVVSGLIVLACAFPYSLRVYQQKTQPNLVSWSIWTVLGLAILLTFKSSGAKFNVWPAVGSFLSPLAVTVLLLWRGKKHKPQPFEILCLIFAVAAIILWWFLKDDPKQAAFALYVSLLGDACALLPTLKSCWSKPQKERPLVWMFYAFGYGLSLFAIEDRILPNYILPIYMVAGSTLVFLPLAIYRLRHPVRITEWI